MSSDVKLDGINLVLDGRVGVGTSAPEQILDVDGVIRVRTKQGSQSGIWFYNPEYGEEHACVDQRGSVNQQVVGFFSHWGKDECLVMNYDNGNVGIGTQVPIRRLHVEGGEIHSGGPSAGYSLTSHEATTFVEAPKNGERWVWYASGGTAHLWSGKDKVSVSSEGKVGIGTQAPTRQLHVQGGEIHSGGQSAGYSFASREATTFAEAPTNGERWVWYASGGTAHLWSGGDKVSVTKEGNLTVKGGLALGDGDLTIGNVTIKHNVVTTTPPLPSQLRHYIAISGESIVVRTEERRYTAPNTLPSPPQWVEVESIDLVQKIKELEARLKSLGG